MLAWGRGREESIAYPNLPTCCYWEQVLDCTVGILVQEVQNGFAAHGRCRIGSQAMLWVLLGWKCNVPCILGHFWQNNTENCCEYWTGVDVQVIMTT